MILEGEYSNIIQYNLWYHSWTLLQCYLQLIFYLKDLLCVFLLLCFVTFQEISSNRQHLWHSTIVPCLAPLFECAPNLVKIRLVSLLKNYLWGHFTKWAASISLNRESRTLGWYIICHIFHFSIVIIIIIINIITAIVIMKTTTTP